MHESESRSRCRASRQLGMKEKLKSHGKTLGGKIVSTGKDTMKMPSSSRMDFPSPYVATCLEHPSQYLNPQVSHHFRRGKTGDRYLAQEDMVSWAFGKERRPWAPRDSHCCHSCCSCSGDWVLGYPSVPRDPQRGLALSPFLCF